MAEELPILKGILKGVVSYHNAPVRFGRVPKREKARILAAMQQSTQNRGNQRALASELDDQPRLLASVLQAHIETCEFTREKVAAMRQRARDCPSYSMPTLACPLNPAPELQSEQEFSQRFAHVIRGVIDFAGMIPGFQLLTQDDKFTLLKAGLFDALFVRLICMFDTSINSIICLNGQVMRRDTIQNGANARFLVDSTFNFAERMNSMQLTDAEIGLFCAIVLITPDRPGLRNVELIERMYTKLKACLQSVITQNRPDKPEFMQELLRTMPDLRTLSTLHTEKLVVFRTEHKELLRQQMWSAEEDQGAVLDAKSPASWSCDGNQVEVEIAKSPMSSVSSTESTETSSSSSSSSSSLSSEYHHLHHHHHQHGGISSAASAAAPLLAATLSGACPIIRHRASSGSSAEDDLIGGTAQHLAQNGLTITPVIRSVGSSSSSSASSASSSSASSGAGASHLHHHHHHHHVSRYRKLDSPTDSGIESGNEKHDNPSPQQQQQQLHHQQHHHLLLHPKPASSSVSSGSSSCSSPRSSLEDPALEDSSSSSNGKAPSLARHASVDNMPVLKRVLQAPPLYDTNSLMDEAYKPHKKFRAMRHRESEAEAASSSTTTTSASAAPSPSATVLASSSSPRPASVPQPQQSVVAIAAPSPPQQPAQQPPQHHQSQLHMHLTRPQTTQSHQSSATGFLQSTSARSSPQPPQQQQQHHHHAYSSLSSTHSVLAKSLMEEPRMTPEQMKRTDIIHNYIMRESAQEQQQNYIKQQQQQQQQQGGLLVCGASAANGVFQRASPHLTVSAVSPAPSSSSSSGSSPAAAAAPNGGCPFGGSSSSASAGRWQQVIPAVTASVITTTGGHRAQQTPSPGSLTPPDTSSSSSSSSLSVVSSPPSAASPSSSSSSATSIRYFQSPHSTMTSPAPPASPSSVVVVAPPHTPSPRLIELKVDIGSSATATTSLDPCHQQPLNLSKKSPSPAPTPVSVVQRSIVGGPSALSPVGAATTVVVATSSSSSNAATSSSSSNNPTIHKILLEA